MHWHRLDRDSSTKVINTVSVGAERGLFSTATSEVTRAPLRFYDKYELYKITNYASLPSFVFQYLSDGISFHYLDGTEEPIYTVNGKGGLRLNEINVLAYVEFFFEHVSGEDGEEILLITDPHDMPLLDSMDPGALDIIMREHQPPKIDYDGGLDAYVIDADLYDGGQVHRAAITVKQNGRVSVERQKMTMQSLSDSGETDYLM